ncbi:protocadherin Fat 4-like [Gigantopelta aegis]|uniref:protocadherin Fat 4-like n=1 Tax=Gigantopelta aegis TaxID=1735272 RepID=UPI001B88AE90|nr:protocadherin Fat 4-like [Gigantopelta aegis]
MCDIEVLTSLLDEPKRNEYNLTVKAVDSGFPQLSNTAIIKVSVPLNYPPTLNKSLYFNVTENATLETRVGQVVAEDKNGDELHYFINEAVHTDLPFKIERDTGIITVNAELDWEYRSQYMFEIFVTDSGQPAVTSSSMVTVNIMDENDNPPQLQSQLYTAHVKEDDLEYGDIQTLTLTPSLSVTDKDGSTIPVYYSIRGDGSELFQIDASTGIIRQAEPGNLDADMQSIYNITIVASDSVLSSEANLSIFVEDINDNTPTFSPDTNLDLEVKPETKIGTVLGQVKAYDSDLTNINSDITYYLLRGGLDKFGINHKTGNITLMASLFDEPRQDFYRLQIRAADSGFPQRYEDITVNITVPITLQQKLNDFYVFEVLENVTVATVVGSVKKQRLNSTHKYFINELDKRGSFPFEIERVSGEIVTTSDLDRETSDMYRFRVVMIDTFPPYQTVSTTVTVNILDVNDNPPILSSSLYRARLMEDDSNPGDSQTLIFSPQLTVSDADKIKTAVSYNLSGDWSHLFVIDHDTGVVQQKEAGSLDSESQMEYNLTLLVSDGTLSSSAVLLIQVEDVNDHAPVFEDDRYIEVDPATKVDTVIGQVKATDEDVSARNSEISFYLLRGGLDKFAINESSGEILLVTSLTDEPSQDEYTLQIQAVSFGTPLQSNKTLVKIRVPLNRPPTLDSIYTYDLLENVTIGTVVGTINSSDPNTEPGQVDKLHYTIGFNETGEKMPFTIDPDTGQITTTGTLDMERIESYNFPVFVSDNGKPVCTSSATVYINVLDVNDNRPQFAAPILVASVKEDHRMPKKPQILDVHPRVNDITDRDAAVEQWIFSISGEGSDLFDIDPKTGVITQKMAGSLDSEMIDLYNFTIMVSDGQLTGDAVLQIRVEDINDNSPVFDMATLEVDVDPAVTPGSVVLRVNASDADLLERNHELHYYLVEGGLDKFAIDESSGVITVAKPLLEEPLKPVYYLKIQVSDYGSPRLSNVTHIVVNVPINFKPELKESYRFEIAEDTPGGVEFGEINATDQNVKDQLKYYIDESSSSKLPFIIDRNTGMLQTSGPLDRETRDQYKFTIFVTNSAAYTSSAQVTVTIGDVNDNPPMLTSSVYTAHITEDHSNPGEARTLFFMPAISASDLDLHTKISYSLAGEGSNFFNIDTSSGEITQTVPGNLDSEAYTNFYLNLTATDGNLTTSARLEIFVDDVNDNAPVFLEQYNFEVNSSASIGYPVGRVSANDLDVSDRNGRVTYYLIQGGLDRFSLNSQTGDISVSESLNSPPYISNYQLHIKAMDSGHPQHTDETTVNIVVPLNKKPYVSMETVLTVKENETIGTEIGIVTVSDPDGNTTAGLSFVIEGNNVPFEIDPATGSLRVSSLLDSENVTQYRFPIVIYDEGVPRHTVTTMTTIHVENVNDRSPRFSALSYTATLNENLSDNDAMNPVPQIYAKDEDIIPTPIVYSLKGNHSDHFVINVSTGEITVAAGTSIDREYISEYDLQIFATDDDGLGLQSESSLQIFVQDVNDNSPVMDQDMSFEIHPSAAIGDKVGKIVANDSDDSAQNNRVTFLLLDGGYGKFFLDYDTGVIYVAGSLVNEPYLENYTLTVRAKDSGIPSLSSDANIAITVPINKPPVVTPQFTFKVEENRDIGTIIGDVSVQDSDNDTSISDVSYSLEGHQGLFKIDPSTGIISTLSEIDAEQISGIEMRVVVLDTGLPTYRRTSQVNVSIVGINDNTPEFSSPSGYTADISEDVAMKPGNVSLQLQPSFSVNDKDGGEVTYTMEGDDLVLFMIDRLTGQIVLVRPDEIDADVKAVYYLQIVATDEGGLSTRANVTVLVGDINDNSPQFEKNFTFAAAADAKKGTVLGNVSAVDEDVSVLNSQIRYTLKTGGFDKFTVDPMSGELTVTDSLVRDPQQSVYSLVIEAVDGGYPPQSAQTTVEVTVPMNYPPVVPSLSVFNVSETFPVGHIIGVINASDAEANDTDSKQDLSFDFHDNNDNHPFLIDMMTGIVTLGRVLDADTVSYYSLTIIIPTHSPLTLGTVLDADTVIFCSLTIIIPTHSPLTLGTVLDADTVIFCSLTIIVMLTSILLY